MQTYSIVWDKNGLDISHLRNMLDNLGWSEIPIDKLVKTQNPFVDFLWIDAEENIKNTWKVRCTFKNMLNDEKNVITNKCNLYENLMKSNPKLASRCLPKTYHLNNFEHVGNNEVYIIRPCGRGFYSGKGIYIVQNDEELNDVKQIYNTKFIFGMKQKKSAFDVIVSEYIRNPLLFKERKFHLRMYLVINIFPKYSYKLWNVGKILMAKDKFVDQDFGNKDIHDTHMKSTPQNLFFPDDLDCLNKKDKKNVFKQMENISEAIAKIYGKFAKPYPESTTAFEVFGVDFMINENLDVKLIELNDRVGYAPSQGKYDEPFKIFSKKYYEFVFKNSIEPIIKILESRK